jgi:hypothetical protein
MDVTTIQARLNERYESFRHAAWMLPNEASAPLLLHIFDEWLQSRNRVLVVGQETFSWGLDSYYHGRPGRACLNCPFEPVTTFAKWRELPDGTGTKALLHAYEIFDFAKTQPLTSRSPFWRAFRELMEKIEGRNSRRAIMWSNLFRVDWNGGSVLKAEEQFRHMISSAQRYLLRDEIAILQPGSVVFVTGPKYDFELKAEFEGVDFQQVDSSPTRRLARLVHPQLPRTSFRTYHPSYLQRSKKWDVIGEIARLIGGSVPTTFP